MSIASSVPIRGHHVTLRRHTQVPMTDTALPVRKSVLIVEDDAAIRELVRLHLELAGFETTEVGDGSRALGLVRSTRFDLVVLDVMLPGVDGVTLCSAARLDGVNRETPILILTARDSESDKVVGLESGADDYLTKPFGVREFVARVGAIMRRSARGEERSDATTRQVRSRDVSIDLERRHAIIRDGVVDLTKQEFDLLALLVARRGIVFSRAALLARVWPGDTYVTERTVDTVVSRLRRKIERDPQDPELILTAWGVGYKFADVE
jgi:two-component system, OmpR family, alkaline phosphatase synthesis response regulator PhoP